MKEEYSLLKSYEWYGTFWFENNKEEIFSGKLKYNPTIGISLEILSDHEAILPSREKYVSHILGIVDGYKGLQKVSLLECFIGKPSSKINTSIIIKFRISALTLIIGDDHFNNNHLFLSCHTKYKYMDEFFFQRDNKTSDTLLKCKLNNDLNVNIYSIPEDVKWEPEFFIYKKAENETEENYENRKTRLNDLINYVTKELEEIKGHAKSGNKYICKFQNNNNEPLHINILLKSVVTFKTTFSLLMLKILYAEQIFVSYNTNTSNNRSVFVFYPINNLNQEKLERLQDSTVFNTLRYNPSNIDIIANSKIEKLIEIINDDDNLLLIDYFLSFIQDSTYNSTHKTKEQFIILLSLLEREFYDLRIPNSKGGEKYDKVIKKYANPDIIDCYIGILENTDIDSNKCTLRDIIILKNNSIQLGAVLSFLRNKIVHNQENLTLKNLETQLKKDMINNYQKYWSTNDYILGYITILTSILLLKILYTKIGFNEAELQAIIDRLLKKYNISKEHDIAKVIKTNTQHTKLINN